MTAIIAHQPTQRLPMSPVNSNVRRLSARIQEKEATLVSTRSGENMTSNGANRTQTAHTNTTNKKRKVAYEEDDDGFAFTRVKKPKKTRQSMHDIPQLVTGHVQNEAKVTVPAEKQTARKAIQHESAPKERRQRMSFSTPNAKHAVQQRRSQRLSSEAADRSGSPAPVTEQQVVRKKRPSSNHPQQPRLEENKASSQRMTKDRPSSPQPNAAPAEESAGMKIALPVSDTPVIRRNKAMREGRGSKGERRSSLGLRGRRASSLIDTGSSNALPHREVEVDDFYKHIESGLMEPRRLRQLLTWCATRAMHPKPQGSEFEDTHKIMSARAIEEELLKELTNKPELSDWFGREDAPTAKVDLPERPNPKNVQNTAKTADLEQQIERLRAEKHALQALSKPVPIPQLQPYSTNIDKPPSGIDDSLLSPEDRVALEMLTSTATSFSTNISQRINNITTNLGPTVDNFADGIQRIAQYRSTADALAGRILSICAERFAQREAQGRRKALQIDQDRSPARDMTSVLRGLSRVDR